MSCSPVFIIAAIVFMLHDTDIAQAASACNTNDHCIPGWICAGGIAQNGNANYKGYCKPNVVLRQLCNIHQIAEGKFARVAIKVATRANFPSAI